VEAPREDVLNECDRLKSIAPGREILATGHDLPRHRHFEPYAIVVVAGAFDQVGYAGRVRVVAGDLLVQPALDCHANRLAHPRGATIVRLPWRDVVGFGGVYALRDLDAVVRAAERDVHAAVELARAHVRRRAAVVDLPDLLATALGDDHALRLGDWAERTGLARETVSRAFASAYGVSPRRFRRELRARAACLQLARSGEGLAAIAAATGYADQAHMTRDVRRLVGMSPVAWRRDPRVARYLRAA
jgi:AraC-like DNA-binding protein